ncbi:MFS transporter [Virgisporangium ochraceum]|uniref:MFS transporter n=1 Tax=Virgisporangium ochraceum TaxID=65505 RepID=UPI0019459F41|nr:MFS transporter [Virgisporangium ochraceum]
MSRGPALAVLCVVQFMVVLDSTITTVALDAVRADLGADERTLQYVLSLYAVTFGGLLLLAGRVGDLAGRRRVFRLGAAAFTGASLLCAAAPTLPVLLAGRAAQGAGAAFASATAFALVLELFPEPAGRHRAIGVWSALGASGAAAGLILGGVLTDLAGWPLVFAVNGPPGAVAVLLAGRLLPPGRAQRVPLDVPGAITATAATATLVFAVTRGPAGALLAVAAVLFVAFVLIEARAPDPLLPLPMITRGPLPVAAVALGCLAAVIGSQGFFLVLHLQRILGFGPAATGLAIAPAAVLAFVGSTVAARLAGRVPARVLVVTGLLLVAVAQLLLGRLGEYVPDLLPGLLLFGVGLGVAFVGTTVLGTAEVADGRASGVLNTAQQVGLAVGVAVLVGATTVAGTADPAALARGYGAGLRLGALVAVTGVAVVLLSAGVRTPRRRPVRGRRA